MSNPKDPYNLKPPIFPKQQKTTGDVLEKIVASDFANKVANVKPQDMRFGPALSSGTPVYLKVSGRFKGYLVTDWTAKAGLQSAEVSYGTIITAQTVFNSTGKGVGPITPKSIIYTFTDPFIEATSIPSGNPRLDLQLYVSTVGIPIAGNAIPAGDTGLGIFNNDAQQPTAPNAAAGLVSSFVHSSVQNGTIYVYLGWKSETANTTWDLLNGRLLVLYQ